MINNQLSMMIRSTRKTEQSLFFPVFDVESWDLDRFCQRLS
jgi:hypothetical protein